MDEGHWKRPFFLSEADFSLELADNRKTKRPSFCGMLSMSRCPGVASRPYSTRNVIGAAK
jgi:hypothetical protein